MSAFSHVLLYVLAVIAPAAIGGPYAAAPTVITAAILVNHYFTEPLRHFTVWDADGAVFILVAGVVSALSVWLARTANTAPTRRDTEGDLTAAVDNALHAHVNAEAWCAVYRLPGPDRKQYALWAPGQARTLTAALLADAVHDLPCDCANCQQSPLLAG